MDIVGGRYTKKPVTIEAVKYDGVEFMDEDSPRPMFEGSFDCLPEWLIDAMAKGEREAGAVFLDVGTLRITTLEGEHIASPGDYIIRGVQGELYPCKPDIFEATYSPAKDTAETSAEVGSIAGELMNLKAEDLDNIAHHDDGARDELLRKIHAVAGSALGQRQ